MTRTGLKIEILCRFQIRSEGSCRKVWGNLHCINLLGFVFFLADLKINKEKDFCFHSCEGST